MPDNKAEQRREEAEARADEYHSTSETARPLTIEKGYIGIDDLVNYDAYGKHEASIIVRRYKLKDGFCP